MLLQRLDPGGIPSGLLDAPKRMRKQRRLSLGAATPESFTNED